MDSVANGAFSRLASGVTSSATSFTVLTGQGARFSQSPPYNLSIYDSLYPNWADANAAGKAEIVRCTNISSDTLTVTRAQESTTAKDFNESGHFYVIEQCVTNALLTSISPSTTVQFLYGGIVGTLSGAVTRFFLPGIDPVSSALSADNLALYFNKNVVLDQFTVKAKTKTGAGSTILYVNKDAVNTALAITISGTGVLQNLTNSVSFTAATNALSLQITVPGTDTVGNVAYSMRMTITL